jgi:hypothetical protein
LQRLILCALLRKLSLGLGALVLDLLRLFSAVALDALLAFVLLPGEATVMSESMMGTMSSCSESQTVFPPNSLRVHALLCCVRL